MRRFRLDFIGIATRFLLNIDDARFIFRRASEAGQLPAAGRNKSALHL
jgi:hypothetical protein